MTDVNGEDKPLVFVSYSHDDKAHKEQVLNQLSVLSRLGILTPWYDGDIGVGEAWYEEIEEKLNGCAVAVLLVSATFLGSKFCMQDEVPVLLERRKREGMLIVPILVEDCYWQAVPWLNAIQIRPGEGNAMHGLARPARNTAYAAIVKEIHEFLDSDQAKTALRRKERASLQETEVCGDGNAVVQIQGSHNTVTIVTAPKADAAWPELPASAVDTDRLPTTGYDLLGRKSELQMLDEAWASEKTNIVALRAWGGVGKSTLLNKWVEYLGADNYRGAGRVFAWSFYSQGTNERVTSADAFIDEALTFFGEGEPALGSPWSRGERLADLVGREQALLLLDGMEPLQDAYQGIKDPALSRLIECLAVRNEGLCVITTREPVKEFEGFSESTQQVDLEQISPEAGRALLRVKGIRGSDAELEAASAAFGNHALAINLLASYLKDCEGRHIQFADDIPELANLEDDNHRHPRRVMAAFAERFGEGPELDLLHMMGLFDRPADAACIAALRKEPAVPGLTEHLVLGDSEPLAKWWQRATGRTESRSGDALWDQLLIFLRDLGLLAPASHHDPDELDAHPLVREHFGARLRTERDDAWKAGHLRLFEHLQTVPKKDQPDTLTEMAPLFQAVHHGCAAGRHQEAHDKIYRARIMRKNKHYLWRKLGAFGANLGVIASFFDPPWAKPAANLAEGSQAWLLSQAAFDLRALGRLRDAVAPMRKALEHAVEQEDWQNAAIRAGSLSELHLTLGDVAEAVAMGKASLKHADRSDDADWRMGSRTTLADALMHRGIGQAAKALFEEAEVVQASSRPSYPNLYSFAGYRYCDLLLTLGQVEEVRERAVRSTELLTAAGVATFLDIALDHLTLGRAALALGERDETRNQLDQAVDGLRKGGGMHNLPWGLLARAALFRETKEFDFSRRDLDEVMRVAKRGEMRLHQCDAHFGYARLALAEGRPDAAQEPLAEARRLVQETGYHRRDPDLQELSESLGAGL